MSELIAIQPFTVFGHLFALHFDRDADLSAFAAAITARRLVGGALAAPFPYTREHAEAALLEIRATLINAYMTDASAREAQHVALAEYLDEHPCAWLSERFAEARASSEPNTPPTAAMGAAIDRVIGSSDPTNRSGQRRKPMRLRRPTRKQRNAQRRAAQL
ncbi:MULTISPECIES: hypothetical protein [Achromobacter]|uniref:hypothetical protein n=1 Tax=Achromobacter TaxID=222 RepID=UPI0023F6F035|nr:hypothetical protein [Achromobacter anxifer]MDF8364663.1 hypothetical protein [Achromobacter anxifer]